MCFDRIANAEELSMKYTAKRSIFYLSSSHPLSVIENGHPTLFTVNSSCIEARRPTLFRIAGYVHPSLSPAARSLDVSCPTFPNVGAQ